MRPTIFHAIAAAAAIAGTVPAALAQDAAPVPKPLPNVVAEPTASAPRSDGADSERVKPIVDALNAEASLKGAKMTVVPEADGVTLRGVTLTDAQRKRAIEIATAQAGEGKVSNALQTEQVVIEQSPPQPVAPAQPQS